MVEAEYWKIKSQMLQLRLEETQLEIAFRDLENRKSLFFKENNIPEGNLRFDDEKFVIEEIKDVK